MKLTQEQEIKFLEMVRDLKSPSFFKQEFDINSQQIERLKKELGVESQDDARRLLKKKLMKQSAFNIDTAIAEEKIRLEQANARLKEEKQKPKKKAEQPDAIKLKKQDAKRQKTFEASQEIKTISKWRLPEEETPERFYNDIISRGIQFCLDKYAVEVPDIYAEATRLKLKINWDLVPK